MIRIPSAWKLLQNSKIPKHSANVQQRFWGKFRQISAFALPENEIQAALQGLFVEILARLSYAQAESGYSDEAVKLQNFLNANLDRIVSTKELAAEIYRSPDYCQKLFRREFGVTPYAYQLDRKMQIAKALLTDTTRSVGEIAESLGYSDLHYFSNLFMEKCGCRPLRYRKTRMHKENWKAASSWTQPFCYMVVYRLDAFITEADTDFL